MNLHLYLQYYHLLKVHLLIKLFIKYKFCLYEDINNVNIINIEITLLNFPNYQLKQSIKYISLKITICIQLKKQLISCFLKL